MKTFCDIISRWPRLSDFADDISVKPNHAKQMRTRDSIPAQYWLAVVEAAQGRGLAGITLETFADIAAAKSKPEITESAQ